MIHLRKLSHRRAASLTAVFALAGSVALVTSGPASAASSTNVDQWRTGACGYNLCLWYHAGGQGQGGAGFGTEGAIANLTGYHFFIPGSPNNNGLGEPVRNNAGEISNGSEDCTDYAFYSPNYGGPSNYVEPGWGGNLNAALDNNEASVMVVC